MSRSRLVVLASMIVVAVGVVAAIGALWFDPARAAVGPMPASALLFPAEARYVMGFDVKRFTASPFYARYGSQKGMRPESLAQFQEKTGLDPERDVDQIVIAGTETVRGGMPAIALVTGRFDLYKLGRTLETEGKVRGYNHDGVTVYAYKEEGPSATAIAFLDDSSVLFGQKDRVEAAVSSRTRGEAPLRGNAVLLALVEKVRPGSTFWMVGDQSLLAGMPSSIPAPGATGGGGGGSGATISLPALRSLTVTGDLDPQVSLDLTGEAADEPAARNLADVVRGFVALMSLQAQQKPELQQLASAFNVATEQNRVLVTARIPYAMIDALSAKAQAAKPAAPASK
jgi:hypothetical protein